MRKKKIIDVISIGILIIVIIFSVYLINKAFTKPHFKITKKELIVSEEIYNYCISYCKENSNNIGCINFPCSNLIEQIEVDEISYISTKAKFCDADSCIDFPHKRNIPKESINKNWLDENCKCIDECPPNTEMYKGNCHHKAGSAD